MTGARRRRFSRVRQWNSPSPRQSLTLPLRPPPPQRRPPLTEPPTGPAFQLRLSKDEIRAVLFSPEHIEYSVKQDDFVMEVMIEAARYLLQKTPTRKVFLDGHTFSRRYQIDRVLQFACQLAQPWTIIECTCSDESARQRLALEPDPSHPAHNRTFALYLEVKGRFEPITYAKTTISTDQRL